MVANIVMDKLTKPLVIAHRGAAGERPENTMAAFDRAIEQGCDCIELDVRLTADGVPVVFHDRNVVRMTGIDKRLSEMTLAEVQTVRIAQTHRIPVFEDIIAQLCHKTIVDIEIKEDRAVTPVLAILDKLKLNDHVLISSFSELAVREVHRLNPNITTGLIMGHETWNLVVRLKETVPFISLWGCHTRCLITHHSLALKPLVSLLHLLGFTVFVYASIKEEKEVNRNYFSQASSKNVDGIASIWPGQLRQTII